MSSLRWPRPRSASGARACARVQALVERAVEAGQLPADTDAGLAAHALHAYVMGLMQAWVQQPHAFDLAAAAPSLVESIVAGLRTNPPRRSAVDVARDLHDAA